MIEVGEYVRTNLGHIGKIIKEYTFKNGEVVYPEPQEWVLDNKYVLNEAGMYQMGEQIVKHSKKIIDLVEVGDYVNGKEILRINDYGEHKRADFNLDYDDCDAVYNEDIKSIVTKEQMKSVEYIVKEEQ